MKARVERRLNGFSAAQLFDVAADFSAYPRFLPLCRAMRAAGPMPPDAAGRQFHLILEVTDASKIVPLTDYRRVVIDVAPTGGRGTDR